MADNDDNRLRDTTMRRSGHMRASRLFGTTLIVFAWMFLVCSWIARAQEQRTPPRLEPLHLEVAAPFSVDDLSVGERDLESLRTSRQAACADHSSNDRLLCGWHADVSATLRKLTPNKASELIGVWDAPYKPFNFSRVQSNLTFLTFVPVDRVIEGRETLARWRQQATGGELTRCAPSDAPLGHNLRDDVASFDVRLSRAVWAPKQPVRPGLTATPVRAESCLAVVASVAQPDGLQFLLMCDVSVVGQLAGPPTACIAIAASTTSSDWLLADAGMAYVLYASNGKPDFTYDLFFSIHNDGAVTIDSSRKVTQDAIMKAAARAIRSEPLLLQTALSGRVLGVSPRRASPLLAGWNEDVTVRVDVDSVEVSTRAGGPSTEIHFRLEISTSMLVNRQKSADPNSWHQPSTAQIQTWTDAVRLRLLEELSHLCTNAVRRDDFSLLCH